MNCPSCNDALDIIFDLIDDYTEKSCHAHFVAKCYKCGKKFEITAKLTSNKLIESK